MVDHQELLVLVANVTLKSHQLLAQGTVLLSHMPNLLLKGYDLPCLSTETTTLSHNDAFGVLLQLKQVLGISCHVCPTTVVVVLKDIACLINVCLPLQIGVVLDRVQRDGCAHGVKQALRAQGSECDMSSLLHHVVHVIPDDKRGPWAPIRKHRVGQDVDVDLIAG
jgi:hypothetical protein